MNLSLWQQHRGVLCTFHCIALTMLLLIRGSRAPTSLKGNQDVECGQDFRISTAAHLALAASQPAISIIEKRWSEETATSGKASSLSIISELAAVENFLLL